MFRALAEEQRAQFAREGYTMIRGALDDREIERFERAFHRHPPLDGPVPGVYPAPGRYTLAKSCMADPDLAFVAEHPTIVEGARLLLDDDPILTAFVVYDRTPGGPGIPAHNDYKRWRPVGSSMKWLFTIVALDDFDAETGQLFVAPGSHRLDRIRDLGGPTLEIDPAIQPDEETFIDPEIRRVDLLFMDMHLWHKAAPNVSDKHRIGFFNKYAARRHPPATGYFQFSDAAFDALSPQGQDVMAFHSDKRIANARLLLQNGDRYLLLDDGLPGGPTFHERAIPDWDLGNYIASAHAATRERLKIEVPWMTYVGDFEEGDDLARVYAYELNGHGFPVRYDGEWLERDELLGRGHGYEAAAVDHWLDPDIVRGKGISQAQARVDQYAY